MKYTLLFFLFILVLFKYTAAQNFRYRLSVNSSMFVTEIGNSEVNNNFDNLTYSGSEVFKSKIKAGAEAEFLMPIKDKLEMGLEFKYNELAGQTETAPLYNFFLTRYNPLPDTYMYPNESLIYSTKILSVLATSRFYLVPADEETSLFLKTSAGVSFVGTDFTFLKPEYRVEYGVGVLYSRGTRSSEYPKKAAFNGGIGLGTIIEFSNRISFYADVNSSFIYSDIVNGVPNYAYIQQGEDASLKKTNSLSMVAQISIGIIYSDTTVNKLIRNNTRRLQKIFR